MQVGTLIKKSAGMLVFVLLLSGCGFFEKILPKSWRGDSDKKTAPAEQSKASNPNPNPTGTVAETAPSVTRLLRRLSLDMRGTLPLWEEMEAVREEEKEIADFISPYAQDLGFYSMMSEWLRLSWNGNPLKSSLLHRFKRDGDESLPTSVTSLSLIEKTGAEPFLFLQDQLKKSNGFSKLLETGKAFVASDLSSLYPFSETVGYSLDPNYLAGTFSDSRPSLGILSLPGFYSLLPHGASYGRLNLASELLEVLGCQENRAPHLHHMNDLTAEQIDSSIPTTLAQIPSCRQCHQTINDTHEQIQGFASPFAYDLWLGYTTPDETSNCMYYSKSCKSRAEWAWFFEKDSLIEICQLRKIVASIMHLPKGELPAEIRIGDLFYSYHEQKQNLVTIFSTLINTESYQFIFPANGNVENTFSGGVRFLNRAQWRGIVASLIGDASAIDFPPALDAGAQNESLGGAKIPSTTYVYAVSQVAYSVAHQLVTSELANTSFSFPRKLFKKLSDNDFANDDPAVVKEQIAWIWYLLTAQYLDPEDSEAGAIIEDYYGVFIGGQSGGSPTAAAINGWQTLLMAIFLSPEFIMY